MENPIQDFFADQEVFITGGTGLMGKILLEKLLRSCPRIKRIFILIREKKGETFADRFNFIKKSKAFENVLSKNENIFNKVTAISGDINSMKLGMFEESMNEMKNVSIIFHVAASVRFDESLKNAILLNIRGTREALDFAKELGNFKIFVHVSTAYSNPYLSYIKEEIYPAKADWKKVIKIAETLDSDVLDIMTLKFITGFPNTYSMTKHLAEQVVNDYRQLVPVVILRPTIVFCSAFEPFPGWFDNFYAVMGMLVCSYSGILRTVYCNSNTVLDLCPLDYAIATTIVAAWREGVKPLSYNNSVPVYNISTTNVRSFSIKTMGILIMKTSKDVAFNKCLWYPSYNTTNNVYKYYLNIYLFHVIPAIIIDGIATILRKDPFLLKTQRRTLTGAKVLEFFMFNEFTFETSNYISMLHEVKNYEEFRIDKYLSIDSYEYILASLLGARRYLLNEDDTSIPKAQTRFRIMKYTDILLKKGFLAWICYLTLTKLVQFSSRF